MLNDLLACSEIRIHRWADICEQPRRRPPYIPFRAPQFGNGISQVEDPLTSRSMILV